MHGGVGATCLMSKQITKLTQWVFIHVISMYAALLRWCQGVRLVAEETRPMSKQIAELSRWVPTHATSEYAAIELEVRPTSDPNKCVIGLRPTLFCSMIVVVSTAPRLTAVWAYNDTKIKGTVRAIQAVLVEFGYCRW